MLAHTERNIAIAGGGIGGMGAALQAARAGWQVDLLERSAAFTEVGAGVQLGPNATRILDAWGMGRDLASVASFPARLAVYGAGDDRCLGTLRLGPAMRTRYGGDYATVHRRDLHALLYRAAAASGSVEMRLSTTLTGLVQDASGVQLLGSAMDARAAAVVGADGLWSTVRSQLPHAVAPRATGHVAYRAMVAQAALPAPLRSGDVRVWLGPRLHAVAYPVRQGAWLNVVVVVEDARPRPGDWDQAGVAADLVAAMGRSGTGLRALVDALAGWRLWPLSDVRPLGGACAMAQGRIALLGDAAHAMPPYLAQGAAMALEDAAELGNCLSGSVTDPAAALQRYAAARWRRNRRVQQRARRNGTVFHARGLLRVARDAALRVLGERLLDVPWLYAGGAAARPASA